MILTALALVGSLVLVFQHRPVLFPVIALTASGLEALSAWHLVHVSVARVPLPLVFGVALAVAGIGSWLRAAQKTVVSAATVVALVGAIQIWNSWPR